MALPAERWEAGNSPEGPSPTPESNIKQRRDTTCSWAALANLDRYAFGYYRTDSEEDIRQKAQDLGIKTHKKISFNDARRTMETMGYQVFQRQNLEDIIKELESGKGLILFRNKHATAIHLDEYGRIIKRDPRAENPEYVEMNEDTLRGWLGVNARVEKTETNPYGRVLIVGRLGSVPVTGESGEIDPVAKTRMEVEQRLAENEKLSIEQRTARIFNKYRPHIRIPGSRPVYKRATRDIILNVSYWESAAFSEIALGRKRAVPESTPGGKRAVSEGTPSSKGMAERIFNDRLDKAYIEQIKVIKKTIEEEAHKRWHGVIIDIKTGEVLEGEKREAVGRAHKTLVPRERGKSGAKTYSELRETVVQEELGWLEARLLAERIVFADQDELIRKAEVEYMQQLQQNIQYLEADPTSAYTETQRVINREWAQEMKQWQNRIKSEVASDTPNIVVAELEVELYILRPDIADRAIENELRLMLEPRLKSLEKWDTKAFADMEQALPELKIVIDKIKQGLEGYEDLPNRLERLRALSASGLDSTQIREFLEIQTTQSKLYYDICRGIAGVRTLIKETYTGTRLLSIPEITSISALNEFLTKIELPPKEEERGLLPHRIVSILERWRRVRNERQLLEEDKKAILTRGNREMGELESAELESQEWRDEQLEIEDQLRKYLETLPPDILWRARIDPAGILRYKFWDEGKKKQEKTVGEDWDGKEIEELSNLINSLLAELLD